MSHSADYAFGPLVSILSAFHQTLVPDDIMPALSTFRGEHTFVTTTFYPPVDNVPRNITSWLAKNITIGGDSFDETGLGGPSLNTESFNPAVILWNTGTGVSFITVCDFVIFLKLRFEKRRS